MSFLTDIFGKTKPAPPQPVTPSGFSGGGLNGEFQGNGYVVGATPGRNEVVGNIANNFDALGNAYGGLADTVKPGYNDLLQTRLAGINDSARSAVGNLQQNLQSRRVLGSSFGQDTITRANAEFSRQRDAATADNFLQSLNASTQLIGKQYEAYNQKFQTGLTEMNLEAGIASKLSGDASSILAQNAKAQAQAEQFNATMANNQAAGLGKLVGNGLFSSGSNPISSMMSGGINVPGMGMPGGSLTA